MHIITKILVVFAAVLSILLATLSVAFSANAERITQSLAAERNRRIAAEQSLQERIAQHSESSQSMQLSAQGHIGELRERDRQIQALERENQRLLAASKTAEAGSQAVLAKIDQLAAAARTQANLIQSYRDEVQKLREDELRYTQREIELADRISDLTGQLEVAIETNRALQEQLAELQMQLALGPPGESIDRPALRPGDPIRARITDVRRDPGSGALLASIDAGTNDRLREGMELTIVRGGSFIAKLVLQSVSLNNAVGRVDTLNRQVEVRSGDLVTTIVR